MDWGEEPPKKENINSNSGAFASSGVQYDANATQKASAQEFGWAERTPIDYASAQSKEPAQAFFHSEEKYEYGGDYGDVGPRVPDLEAKLFNTKYRVEAGDMLNHLMSFNVIVEGSEMVKRVESVSIILSLTPEIKTVY